MGQRSSSATPSPTASPTALDPSLVRIPARHEWFEPPFPEVLRSNPDTGCGLGSVLEQESWAASC